MIKKQCRFGKQKGFWIQLNTNTFIFYLPFTYFYFTRLKTPSKGFGWFFSYVIPIVIGTNCISVDQLSLVIILIVAIYTVYEYGYIYNDSFTIKKETNPTLRLENDQIQYARQNITKILVLRSFSSIFLHCIISLQYSIIPILILIVYYLYNSCRSRLNLLLHFFLVTLRFCSIFLITSGFVPFLFSILLFPSLNLVERMSESRFSFGGFIKRRSNIIEYRVYYYSLLVIVFYFLDAPKSLFYAACYYFLFRLTIKLVNYSYDASK